MKIWKIFIFEIMLNQNRKSKIENMGVWVSYQDLEKVQNSLSKGENFI